MNALNVTLSVSVFGKEQKQPITVYNHLKNGIYSYIIVVGVGILR
jgi:hypothetical protein